MTNLYNGEIKDILPENLKYKTHVICLSYAIQRAIQRTLTQADSTRVLAMVDTMPETTLNVLAVELRSPYYDEEMDIRTKRNIVKNSLVLRSKAGTKSAVKELLRMVFGDGEVTEWFDFPSGELATPGTFDIKISSRVTEENLGYFNKIINEVKNARSHLRRVNRDNPITAEPKFAGVLRSVPHITIRR